MRQLIVMLAALAASALVHAQTAKSPLEEEVLQADRAATKSFVDRSVDDLAKLVDDEAVYFHGGHAIKGKEAVVAFVRPIFAAPLTFSYTTTAVNALPSGLAMTEGVIYAQPGGAVIARYNTVWRKGADGRWKIVFDRSWPASQ